MFYMGPHSKNKLFPWEELPCFPYLSLTTQKYQTSAIEPKTSQKRTWVQIAIKSHLTIRKNGARPRKIVKFWKTIACRPHVYIPNFFIFRQWRIIHHKRQTESKYVKNMAKLCQKWGPHLENGSFFLIFRIFDLNYHSSRLCLWVGLFYIPNKNAKSILDKGSQCKLGHSAT